MLRDYTASHRRICLYTANIATQSRAPNPPTVWHTVGVPAAQSHGAIQGMLFPAG